MSSTDFDITGVSPEKLEAVLASLAAEKERRVIENALAHYQPYARQRQFHEAGASKRERLLMAANQSGKSLAGGMECAMHATGRYPDWWQGRRFDKPTIGWVAGTTNETTRDTVQRILVGRSGQQGTGTFRGMAFSNWCLRVARRTYWTASRCAMYLAVYL